MEEDERYQQTFQLCAIALISYIQQYLRYSKLIFKYTHKINANCSPSAYLQLNEYIGREGEMHLLEQFNPVLVNDTLTDKKDSW